MALLTPREKKKLGAIAFSDLLVSLADILFLALLLFIIQFYTKPESGKIPLLPSWLSERKSVLLITIFFFLFSLKNLVGFFIYRNQCRFLMRISSRLSQTMLKRYLNGPFSEFVNIDSAIHIRKISHQPIEFSHHVLGSIQQIFTQLMLILFSIMAILIFKPKIFLLLLLILLPPVIAVFYYVKKRLRTVKINLKKNSDRSLQNLQEALTGYVESNIYNKNDFFLGRYTDYLQKFNTSHSNLLIVQGVPTRTIEIFAIFGLLVLVALNKWSGTTDSETIVTIGAFMAAAYKIIPGIVKILNLNGQIHTYSQAVFELFASLKANDFSEENSEAKVIRSVEFKDVGFRYSGEALFNNLDLNMKQGDFVGLSGISGRGKTTIVNLLLGFSKPDSGEILINGNITDPDGLRRYWKSISYVKQQNFLIHDTISSNITLSENHLDTHKLQQVISTSGLSDFINSFPEKENRLIMENGKNISGGQRQRIAIARALYKDADLIILDEPFNELDEKSEHRLLNHFKQLAEEGKLIILVTHNKKSLSFCNKIIFLDE